NHIHPVSLHDSLPILNDTIQVVTMELEAYRFDRATNALYHFFWHEYCDWYLELIKPVLQETMHPQGSATRRMLQETLEVFLRLLDRKSTCLNSSHQII